MKTIEEQFERVRREKGWEIVWWGPLFKLGFLFIRRRR